MTQEQMEEMMDRQGQGQSRGSKELEVSLEQQEGSSAQDSQPAVRPASQDAACLLSHAPSSLGICVHMCIPLEDSPQGNGDT